MSTYKACVEADTEGDGLPFTAQVQGKPCFSAGQSQGHPCCLFYRAMHLCHCAFAEGLIRVFLHLNKAAGLVKALLKVSLVRILAVHHCESLHSCLKASAFLLHIAWTSRTLLHVLECIT